LVRLVLAYVLNTRDRHRFDDVAVVDDGISHTRRAIALVLASVCRKMALLAASITEHARTQLGWQ
jgi:hypothetical protein